MKQGDNIKKENAKKKWDVKGRIKPNEIKGKIDVPDSRERRDGPGGN